jgi:hypothetical protein
VTSLDSAYRKVRVYVLHYVTERARASSGSNITTLQLVYGCACSKYNSTAAFPVTAAIC